MKVLVTLKICIKKRKPVKCEEAKSAPDEVNESPFISGFMLSFIPSEGFQPAVCT